MASPPLPKWDVDCSANPYDIRPAINAIMAAENFILKRLPAGQKLVILVGELHDNQTHVLLQKALLQQHAAQSIKFAYGCELPHDFRIQQQGAVARFKNWITKAKPKPDPDDRLSMAAYNKAQNFGFSQDATKVLFDHCMQERISVRFNDISWIKKSPEAVIEQKDPYTRDLVLDHKPELAGEKIIRARPEGIALSNIAITRRAKAHIDHSKADVYIQQCGIAHVAGSSLDGTAYEDSLTARFREQGYAVLPVFLADEHMSHEGLKAAGIGSVNIKGLANLDDLEFSIIEARLHINKHSGYNL